jgi:NAD(P)-dependent dehydrogenase (short-subunit alcohol dehydrogenase family)
MSTQKQRSIFITGSSSGLGRATAKLFASKGWKVIATMRSPDTKKELTQIPNVTVLALDVTNPDQIMSVAQKVASMGSLDVVFNNAGYGIAGPLEALTDQQILRVVETNMLGAIRTTKAFIPLFRKQKSGLFITTTSIGGLMTVPFNSMYHATKWALEGWGESMAFELKQMGIGFKLLEPGGMKTDFFTRSFDSAQHPAYGSLAEKVMSVVTDPQTMASYSTPEQIAAVVYEAATDGKDQLRYVAGADAQATYAARLQAGEEAFRKGVQQRFFGVNP